MAFDIFSDTATIDILGQQIAIGSILVGVIIMVVGVIVARIFSMFFKRYIGPNLEPHSAKSLNKLIFYGIIIITLLGVTTSQGIDLSGLMVAGGIFGIVIGFATQSVVANVISGIFLMIERPIKTGEVIEMPQRNIFGILLDITIFSTRVKLFDGSIMRVPNDKVFTEQIRNVAATEVRRIDVIVGIAYKAQINKAITAIRETILARLPFVLIDPEPAIWTDQLADSGVNLKVLVWFPRNDWGEVGPVLLQVVKEALDEAGIEIPFPQRVVWHAQEPQKTN